MLGLLKLKSYLECIASFGDLSKADDRKLTEYMLIGSLLSFGLAIAISYGYLWVLEIVMGD